MGYEIGRLGPVDDQRHEGKNDHGKRGTAQNAVDDLSREGSRTAGSIRGLADKLKEDPSQIINPPTRKGVEIPK